MVLHIYFKTKYYCYMLGTSGVGSGRSFLVVFFVLAITFCLVSGGIFKANTTIGMAAYAKKSKKPSEESSNDGGGGESSDKSGDSSGGGSDNKDKKNNNQGTNDNEQQLGPPKTDEEQGGGPTVPPVDITTPPPPTTCEKDCNTSKILQRIHRYATK
jgi:hypothetical protein